MQIILSFILSIIILIFFIYHFKINKEGMEIKITGDMQPDPKFEIYDFNLRQAQGIWKDVGCTDGSYKPTEENINLWKHEEWRKELKAYKTEADLYEKEHNYYDFEGLEIDGVTKLKYENRDAVGIGMAYNRCYDASFNTNYRFPKFGDRIKIKKNTKGTTTDYYSGIVLEGNVRRAKNLDVLWDSKGNEGTMVKDTKRTETKTYPVQTDDKKIKKDGLEFGWPYQKWKRHPDLNKERDSILSTKDWIKIHKHAGQVDSKIVYKTMECVPGSNCDNLNCKKRRKEILNRYPITYYCKSDSRNKRKLGSGYMCKSGKNKGMITQYYDETKMCFRDEQGNRFGRKFAMQECGSGNTEEYNSPKKIFGGDCYALISDRKKEEGNRAIIGEGKNYTTADLIKLGLENGKIMSTKLYGPEYCFAKFSTGEIKQKNSSNMAPSNGSTAITLFKEEKGCKLVINNKDGDAIYDKESTKYGLKGGTKFNAAQLVSKGLGPIKNYKFKESGGFDNKEDICRVAFYNWPVAESNKNVKPDIVSKTYNVKDKKALSAHIFKRIKPVIEPGNYTITSKRTGENCYTYYEKDFWGNKTGKVFWQCDNYKGNGPKKNDKFTIEQEDRDDPNTFYIKQGKYCKHQKIGTGYNIKCDKEGSKSSSKSRFKIIKSSGGYHKIKNMGTGKFCTNRRDIVMPGGGIIACNGAGSPSWMEYKFNKK